jgi:deoxyribodipyrimidine photolyase-like uncharacterized protein
LIYEIAEETRYVKRHKKKIVLPFSAMRHFGQELTALGWRVFYRRLDEEGNTGSSSGEVARASAAYQPQRIVVTRPGNGVFFPRCGAGRIALTSPSIFLPTTDRYAPSMNLRPGLPAAGKCAWTHHIQRLMITFRAYCGDLTASIA